jgi:hypothetical protein
MLSKMVIIDPLFMSWEGIAVISVVILQNRMDLLKDEVDSSKKTCVSSTLDGNTVAIIEAERVSHVTKEEDQELLTIPEIKTEPNEHCVPVVSVTQISYKPYPELPAIILLCPCETKI